MFSSKCIIRKIGEVRNGRYIKCKKMEYALYTCHFLWYKIIKYET